MTQPTTITQATTHTLDVPGSTLTYDVRESADADPPVLMVIGSPMGASGFVTLGSHFPDRTIVTYDPRGSERSVKADPTGRSTPEKHADDIHAVISAVGRGSVDLFATSGGAINALALVAGQPGDVRLLVAHEPPLASILPDREAAYAATEDIAASYQRDGLGPAMAKFIMLVMHEGDVPADFASMPVDPAMFGLPTEDDGNRTDPVVGSHIITATHYEPDFEAIRAGHARIVVAIGEESGRTLARRGGEAVAERLGVAPVTFPGGHDGFLGGEYGQTGKPDEFAAKLREVLAQT